MARPTLSHNPVGVPIALGASLLAGALGLTSLVRNIELNLYDLRVAATARVDSPSPQIALVAIDNDSVRRMEPIVGRWPWPRLVHATLIDYLVSGGAKVIVYDVLFAERDQRKFMVGDTEWTGADSDAAMVEATRKAGNVVHAAEVAGEELIDPSRAIPVDLSASGLNQPFAIAPCVERRPVITPPFAELAGASRGIGHTFFVLDADGPLRKTSPLVSVADRALPSLSLAAAMLARGIRGNDVSVDGQTLVIGEARIPLITERLVAFDDRQDSACRALIAWRGPAVNSNGRPSFDSYSFYDLFYSQQQVIEGQKPGVDPSTFKDRIVVIGATAEGLHDTFTTPFPTGEIPGPEVHANVIDAFLSNRSVAAAPSWLAVALTILLPLVMALAGVFLNAWFTGAVAAALVLALGLASFALFSTGIWLPITVPTLALIFAFVGDLAWKYVVEGREKRKVKRLFSRYVSKDVYAQLVADPSRAALGGTRRNMTVLFSDVRGFTAMSERASPESVVLQLNEYFTRMVSVVFEHRGTVDKFVGDMVMALFGAPLEDEEHAEHAVRTALAMVHALNQLNERWEREGRPVLDIGIGVSTGEMVVGNIGSDTIMSYTVIGDTVNLGARLESLNKDFGTRIIISDATRVRLKGRYDIHPLGEVTVKGKSKPVAIFEVKPR